MQMIGNIELNEVANDIEVKLKNVFDSIWNVQQDWLLFFFKKMIIKRGLLLRMKIDPVCKMEVQEDNAITTEFNGKLYYFCSEGCREEVSFTAIYRIIPLFKVRMLL